MCASASPESSGFGPAPRNAAAKSDANFSSEADMRSVQTESGGDSSWCNDGEDERE